MWDPSTFEKTKNELEIPEIAKKKNITLIEMKQIWLSPPRLGTSSFTININFLYKHAYL